MADKTADCKLNLLQFAPLNHFWILATEHIQPGLIHYLGSDGVAYVLMDDDDDRVERCIEFLREMNCPVFDDYNEMDAYTDQLVKRAGYSGLT